MQSAPAIRAQRSAAQCSPVRRRILAPARRVLANPRAFCEAAFLYVLGSLPRAERPEFDGRCLLAGLGADRPSSAMQNRH
jgi:hypothetical protein